MASALAALALAGCLLSAAAGPECPPPPPASFLCCPAYCLDDVVRTPLRPYVPQEGDLLLFASDKRKWHVLLKLALTDEPWHAGIVVRLPDGHLAAFEAGPDDSLRLELRDLLPRLQGYCAAVWVRQRRTPLTCEQSARLTAFALANEGKRYASVRACGQLTPFRHRGPLSTYLVGKPQGDRRSYWCSELVLEACVAAGLLNPHVIRPSATFPRDIFFDDSPNLYLRRTFDLSPCWLPPSRWLPAECVGPELLK